MRFSWKKKNMGGAGPDLSSLIQGRSGGVLHLTHNDFDAVGCDAIHRRKYGDITTLFCSVGKFPFILGQVARFPGKGDTISITDLGFQSGTEQTLDALKNQGWSIEWRDHHRWRDSELSVVEQKCDVLRVDVSTCATGICARDLAPGDDVAGEIARVVCDYDLWKHEDPRSAVLGQVLQRRENRDYVRDRLVQGILSDDRIMEQYRLIREEMEAVMRKSVRRARIRGEKYRIAFAPMYGYPSETAARMREVLRTDMEVLVSPGGRFSLRSVPPVSHLLARNFGGGGHPNAAGGNFSFTFWDRLVFRLHGTPADFGRFVEMAETL